MTCYLDPRNVTPADGFFRFAGRKTLLGLLNLRYGIVEAERQWICAIESWKLSGYEIERTHSVDQLFINICNDSTIGILVAKVVDDFRVAGIDTEIKPFLCEAGSRFYTWINLRQQ